MSSITNSIYDVAGAFQIVEEPGFLGPDRVWNAVNPQQEEFLPLLQLVRPFVPELKEAGLLDAKVSWVAKVINDWFAERGFSIQLKDRGDPNTFYAGSIYEQFVFWLISGKRYPLIGKNGVNYQDGVRMEKGVSFYDSPAIQGTIAEIATENKADKAYMVALDVPPAGPFGLLTLAQKVSQTIKPVYGDFTELRFPMVHIDHTVDMEWLVNFWTNKDSGRKAWVSEAKQQSILKINEKGALAKSGFGMSVSFESIRRDDPLIIDSPFLFWISRDRYPLPLFSAWVDYDDWKNPGELK